ncbi:MULTISPECIES: ABC transporter ATP-binding protein [Pseudoalteromonas]|uniref:ABC transporter ATP-binding protein n=1 Tax=Pseudoalteromonas TaxID=53246 RepID=UPI0005FA2BB0|nr:MULTISPECIES: ABC transporter ATP-binding protein [Pseudoalteromonas]KJZ05079.1 ABC transporter [Pseudoalteromonas piscicida]QUI71854.1 ATP-binding cassette domain-containing protein [Pseudoalteromonas sp. M8]
MAVTPQFQVDKLSVQLGGKAILKALSFAINSGEFIGLLGPNGAGKSTLLRTLYQYTAPSSGSLLFNGKPLASYGRKAYARHVAVVLQEIPAEFTLPLFDMVLMGLTPNKSLLATTTAAEKQAILHAIEQVGLSHKLEQCFSSLSGGEKQRAMIARAMVQAPQVLIMDEPTSHLDIKYQIQIMELAKQLGVTIIASFHDLNLASALCDRLLVLNNGELVADGSPLEVINETLLSQVFGVCAEVSTVRHPPNNSEIPHIRFHYGYQL